MWSTRLLTVGLTLAILGVMLGCGHRSGMKRLTDRPYKALDPAVPVTVYVGQPGYPFQEVAIIDSTAYGFVDEAVKLQQIEELKDKARGLGANLVMDIRILSKRMQGFTIDEQVPFTAWKQGDYDLYFMRGVAARAPYEDPGSLAEVRPEQGWLIDQRPAPRNIEQLTSGTQTAG